MEDWSKIMLEQWIKEKIHWRFPDLRYLFLPLYVGEKELKLLQGRLPAR